MKKRPRLLDFTQVETIYEKHLQTVKLKIAPLYIASPQAKPRPLTNLGMVKEILHPLFAALDDHHEHAILLILNPSKEVTGYKLIASGGQDRATIDGKVLFRNALLLGATSIILAHNHPSNNREPSEEDFLITAKLIKAGQTLDIELLDHLIYTNRLANNIRPLNMYQLRSNLEIVDKKSDLSRSRDLK